MLPTFFFALRDDLSTKKEFLPTKALAKATGWDVRAAPPGETSIILKPGQKALIPLGFRGFCPEGWWYELKPRSSTFGKKSLHCLIGTIDEDYAGQLLFACQYIPDATELSVKDLEIKFGEAIGQIIPIRRVEAQIKEVSNMEIDAMFERRNGERGSGGFGSTS